MVRDLMIGAVLLAASAGQTLAQDLVVGEASFRKCQPCHDVGEAAKNKRRQQELGNCVERGKLQGIPREPAREDAGDKDDLVRQEREGTHGLVGLSQAVWR